MNVNPPTRKGFALPVTRERGGFFATKEGADLAWGNMLLPLLTPIGSRPMRRLWGSGLHRLVFEPVEQNDPAVQMTVRDAVQRYCRDVRIRQVSVTPSGNTAQIGVVFSLVDQPTADYSTSIIPTGDLA